MKDLNLYINKFGCKALEYHHLMQAANKLQLHIEILTIETKQTPALSNINDDEVQIYTAMIA